MIKLKEQEQEGSSSFEGPLIVTPGVRNRFSRGQIATAFALVQDRAEKGDADRLQFLDVDGAEVWVVDDGRMVTMLLPGEY